MSSPNDEVAVSYVCQHLSCRNPKCYKAKLTVPQATFDRLYETEPEVGYMRSPTGHCLLGNAQRFQIVDVQTEHLPSKGKDQLEALQVEGAMIRAKLDKLQLEYQQQHDKLILDSKRVQLEIARLRAITPPTH